MEASCQAKPIPSTGLTILVEPENASVDIVFVHGFTGHPERTWTHKRAEVRSSTDQYGESAERPSKFRKINLFSKTSMETSSSVYWPRDLIPQSHPHARVLTYGYDTHIRHRLGPPGSKDSVYDIAWDFLVALEAKRRANTSRPVIFVVHSLGGIVVKEMLRRSSSCRQGQDHLRDIFESTVGIMFFGTPHGGADPGGILRSIAERIFKIALFTINKQILNTLMPSSERLRELRDDFGPIAVDQNWMIHSFQEQYGIPALGGEKVVEDVSSYLNLPAVEVIERIGHNHMDMCRFAGPGDIEYGKVVSALHRMTAHIVNQSGFTQGTLTDESNRQLDQHQLEMLMSSLKFDQIDARHLTIKQAHAKTCKWLLETPEYIDWLNESKIHDHHGFLWIKGKPGTGKSTLMKYALANSRKKMKDRQIISFFFNARGDLLEKSTIGTYRSLLLQLLEGNPQLQMAFESLNITAGITADYQWGVESLKTLLSNAIQRLKGISVLCFIDALDECDELEIRDMISFFEQVGEATVSAGIKFRVCFSSRHYPHVTIRKNIPLILEGHEGHNQDIANCLQSELKIGKSQLAERIRKEVQDKSSSIFMWVILVIRILNMEFDRGRIHGLQRKLREIPADLYELFHDILTRDTHNKDELILSLQWVLFARKPMKPEELYFAILFGVEPEDALSGWDRTILTEEDIRRFIVSASKGLSEITKSKTQPTVQFIHESVRDFLLKEKGLEKILSDFSKNFEGLSHDRLKTCCNNHLELKKSYFADEIRDLYPFLEYATKNVLYHAEKAEEAEVSQKEYISMFNTNFFATWIKAHNLLEQAKIRRYTVSVSLQYILAERNLSYLIEASSQALSYLYPGIERYGPPLLAALATGSEDAVRTFLRVHMGYSNAKPQLRELYSRYCQSDEMPESIGRTFHFSSNRTVQSYLAQFGREKLLAFLIETGEVLPDAADRNGRTPLSWAAEKGHESLVQMLLGTGKVDVASIDYKNDTPIHYAVRAGQHNTVKLLLDTGQYNSTLIDSKDKSMRTLLSLASAAGFNKVVKLLLETGEVDINSKDNSGLTPLDLAAVKGYHDVVKLLLQTKMADINSQPTTGVTPLYQAASRGHHDVVKLLLQTENVDINVEDRNGRNPLYLAIYNGHDKVVKLLLDTKKVEFSQGGWSGPKLLCTAIENGHDTVVKMLLDSALDIDLRKEVIYEPLPLAARIRRNFALELLLDSGRFDANSKDIIGRTALSWAAQSGQVSTVRQLLDSHADPNLKDTNGRTPLSWAVQARDDVVKILIDADEIEADTKDKIGRTPLSWAAEIGNFSVVRLLLDSGSVDLNSMDDTGRTPLSWACEYGMKPVVAMLLGSEQIEADRKDMNGRTPLHWVVTSYYIDWGPQETVVQLLLETGKFDVDSVDDNGQTPLSMAVKAGKTNIVEMMNSYRQKLKTISCT